jgi:hypothetical protein
VRFSHRHAVVDELAVEGAEVATELLDLGRAGRWLIGPAVTEAASSLAPPSLPAGVPPHTSTQTSVEPSSSSFSQVKLFTLARHSDAFCMLTVLPAGQATSGVSSAVGF